ALRIRHPRVRQHQVGLDGLGAEGRSMKKPVTFYSSIRTGSSRESCRGPCSSSRRTTIVSCRPRKESRARYARAGEPKKLVLLRGYGHDEVYTEPAFSEVVQATVDWYSEHLP